MKDFPINEQISARQLHLIMHDGRSAGVVGLDQARYLAAQYGLDLVQISDGSKLPVSSRGREMNTVNISSQKGENSEAPQGLPVAKLLDYNKYRYQQDKKTRGSQKKTRELKEMRLGYAIGEHDLNTKAKRAREFLQDGHFVRLYVQLRGRQNIFPEKAKQTLLEFKERLDAVIEQPIVHIGKKVTLIVKPQK